MVARQLTAIRYVLPLREGGSLPAIVDTDHQGSFVVKFLGAGQGPRALVAEVIAAGLGQALGLNVPEWAIVDLAEGFGLAEPDPEIQDLLRASVGKNFGIRYLPGALAFDPAADLHDVPPELASEIVWFDALITNVDRTVRNVNLLVWSDRVWLIDHGASLYFHHLPGGWLARSQDPFARIKDHVLLGLASDLRGADARLHPKLDEGTIRDVVSAVPEEWLGEGSEEQRRAYVDYLAARLSGPRSWLEEAENARR
jgi:hypothetical protein